MLVFTASDVNTGCKTVLLKMLLSGMSLVISTALLVISKLHFLLYVHLKDFFIVTQFPAAKIESQIEQNREWSSFVTSQRNNEQCNIRYVLWYPAVVSCDSCFNVCAYLVSNFLGGSFLFFFHCNNNNSNNNSNVSINRTIKFTILYVPQIATVLI